MKKVFKVLVFVIGVDCLGFPVFHRHLITNRVIIHSLFFKGYSKN